jgi:hypothetical protein
LQFGHLVQLPRRDRVHADVSALDPRQCPLALYLIDKGFIRLGITMKYNSRRFKNAAVALKEIEPFVRNGNHLITGRPFANHNDLRSREILANWLICAVFNAATRPERLTFVSLTEEIGGDGVMLDTETEETWPTEHVITWIPLGNTEEIEPQILAAIAQKHHKGGERYAGGKTLVVFLEGGGGRPWFANKVARALPQPLLFAGAWVVGLHGVEAGEYLYNVAHLDEENGGSHVWRVRIASEFDKWTVDQIQ